MPGVGGDFVASCITYEMRCGHFRGPRARQEFLSKVFEEMNTWLHDRRWAKISFVFSEDNLGLDVKDAFPTLASKYKAASVKQMCFYMNARYKEWHGGGHIGRLMAAASWALADFLWQLDGQGIFVEEKVLPEACLCGHAFLVLYSALNASALNSGQNLFFIRPKLHALQHIVDMMKKTGINPARASCFKDEDWLGKFKRTSSKCHGSTVHFRGMARYLPYLHMRSQKRETTKQWLL